MAPAAQPTTNNGNTRAIVQGELVGDALGVAVVVVVGVDVGVAVVVVVGVDVGVATGILMERSSST